MNKQKQQFSHFGFSTIITLFVMICLVTFAALSLLSANSDYKLSKKTADNTSSYYRADAQAREFIKALDEKLPADEIKSIPTDSAIKELELIYDNNRLQFINFQVDITDVQVLYVSLELNYTNNSSKPFCQIVEWLTKTELAPDDKDNTMHLLGND